MVAVVERAGTEVRELIIIVTPGYPKPRKTPLNGLWSKRQSRQWQLPYSLTLASIRR